MRLLADAHVSPRTVEFLRSLGHDVQRMSDVLPPASPDDAIVQLAARDSRVILTQDLDFSALIALRGEPSPSLISLRLSSSRVEHVNAVLERILPQVAAAVMAGSIGHGRGSADTGSITAAVLVNRDAFRTAQSGTKTGGPAHSVLLSPICRGPWRYSHDTGTSESDAKT